jgi:glucose 1-dehydrogenase
VRAVVVTPGTANSLAVVERPDPERGEGELLVQGLAVGVCGTDKEIVRADYGWAPPGEEQLILGHESLGRVIESDDDDFSPGDLVAGVVRRPDPQPCAACARGEWDMCRNGRYTERGIKEIHGYGSELWTVPTKYAVKVESDLGVSGVLVEPTSVVAKAWEQVDRVGDRAFFDPARVLVTGAGPIGLLAALLARQRGMDVHMLDVVTSGPKPDLVEQLGATYHHEDVADVCKRISPDVVIEATGVGPVLVGAITGVGAYGIVCLTGVSSGGHKLGVDVGEVNRELVLENGVVVGSVNANLRHYQAASDALAKADRSWLQAMLTRRVGLDQVEDAFTAQDTDVKVMIQLADQDG